MADDGGWRVTAGGSAWTGPVSPATGTRRRVPRWGPGVPCTRDVHALKGCGWRR